MLKKSRVFEIDCCEHWSLIFAEVNDEDIRMLLTEEGNPPTSYTSS